MILLIANIYNSIEILDITLNTRCLEIFIIINLNFQIFCIITNRYIYIYIYIYIYVLFIYIYIYVLYIYIYIYIYVLFIYIYYIITRSFMIYALY